MTPPEAFPVDDPAAVRFGPESTQAYYGWEKDLLEIYWNGSTCSHPPTLIFDREAMTLWLSDELWDDCEANEGLYAFEVEILGRSDPTAWNYELKTEAPPEKSQ